MSDEPQQLSATLSSVERRGSWHVPRELDVRTILGSAVLDLRQATLGLGVTTIDVTCAFGSVEIYIPPHLAVEVSVRSLAGSVSESERPAVAPDLGKPLVRIIGSVKFGSVDVMSLLPGENPAACAARVHSHHMHREQHHRRWQALREEREMWMRARADRDGPQDPRHDNRHWQPWWLMARMRRRLFTWLALAFVGGILAGVHLWGKAPWWHMLIAAFVLSGMSGAIAWRMTRPLLMVVRAARDIGDGKLDHRIDPHHHGGEVRLLAHAINDMAEKIQRQLSDQRQLLAAVSHELRTPLGHMRVLIETARDANDMKALGELEKEVLVLDDLVGKLLASSRLEFGNLDLRELDLGELVTDVATSHGVSPDALEAIGDVKARIDPTLVRRAVANLIENARVHGNGAIAVRILRRAAQVVIEVDDVGPGVAADRRADAFRAFVPSSGGGLGLGLALVSRIAVAHGGGAWIADRPGGGARVGFAVAVNPPMTTA
jgi:signal transduction histidine kinase